MLRSTRIGAAAFLLSFLFCLVAVAEPLTIEVTKAEALRDAGSGMPVIAIEMSPASAAAFGELTRANVGRRVELRLDGVPVMAPLIREPILGGSAQISGLPDDVDPPGLASRIAVGKVRVEVEIVGE